MTVFEKKHAIEVNEAKKIEGILSKAEVLEGIGDYEVIHSCTVFIEEEDVILSIKLRNGCKGTDIKPFLDVKWELKDGLYYPDKNKKPETFLGTYSAFQHYTYHGGSLEELVEFKVELVAKTKTEMTYQEGDVVDLMGDVLQVDEVKGDEVFVSGYGRDSSFSVDPEGITLVCKVYERHDRKSFS